MRQCRPPAAVLLLRRDGACGCHVPETAVLPHLQNHRGTAERPHTQWVRLQQQRLTGAGMKLMVVAINDGATNPAASFVQNVAWTEEHDAVVSEPYAVGEARGWYTDHTSQVAISVSPNCPLAPSEVEKDAGFVAVELGGVAYYICYFLPNQPIEEFNAYLARLEGSTSRRGKVVVAGNFNAKCEEWFAGCTDLRRVLLSEFAATNRWVVMNSSADPTHFHQEFGLHIDMTFASESLARQIKGWSVLEEESGSNHNYICFTVERKKSWEMGD